MRGGMVIYVVVVVVIVQLLLFHATIVQSHGFLSTPRSRNLVAYQDRVYYPITSADPLPEDCPNCLNRGGSLARCGIMNARQLNENNDASSQQERNYDLPQNALGEPMPSNPQMTYVEGSVIDVEVILTAHHRGHFIFKACPISSTVEVPSQECFDNHPLLFVKDALYGATIDTNYPERVYVAPSAYAEHFLSEDGFNSMLYQYQMKLPDGLVGELILIQWYYVAANSDCIHPGYDTYAWPTDWNISTSNAIVSSSWEEEDDETSSLSLSLSSEESESSVGTTGLQLCEDVLPVDGNGK